MRQLPHWAYVIMLMAVVSALAAILVFMHPAPPVEDTAAEGSVAASLPVSLFTKGEKYGLYTVADIRPYNPDEPLGDENYSVVFADLIKSDHGGYLQITGVYEASRYIPLLGKEVPYVGYTGRMIYNLPFPQDVVSGLVIENLEIVDPSLIYGSAPVVFTIDRYTYHRYKGESVAIARLQTWPMDLDRYVDSSKQVLTTVPREGGRIFVPYWKFSFAVPEGYTYTAYGDDKNPSPMGRISIKEIATGNEKPIQITVMIDVATHGSLGDYKHEPFPLDTPVSTTATLSTSLDPRYPGSELTWTDTINGVDYIIVIGNYEPRYKPVLEAFLGSFAWE